jgi:hypothetical protein
MALKPSIADAPRTWTLYNRDTFEIFQGQFHAEELRHEGVAGAYAERWALGRTHPVQQFLRSERQSVTFRSRFHATTAPETAEESIETLKSWTQPDTLTNRPPVLEFWVGRGTVNFFENPCVLESVGDLTYHRPTIFGGVRHVEFTITLREYKEFKIQVEAQRNTRYHRVKQGEYYELLAYREYRNPALGDTVRKRHPAQATLQPGDVVALPTVSKLLRERLELTSIPLATSFGRKDTAQRTRRIEWFDRRDETYVSHVLQG